MAPAQASPASPHRLLRVFGALTCIGLSAADSAADRRHPDEEVLASQSYYPAAWRKHYNDGDMEFCGKAYQQGAALHVALQPGLTELSELTGWKDGMVVRGQEDITGFWKKAAESLGRCYEGDADSGDFASRRFVVDDNTVIVSGPAAWCGARGHKLSQTWTRLGAEWKISSEMLQLEEYTSPTQKPKPALLSEVAKIVKAAEGKGSNDKLAQALSIGKVVAEGLGKEVKELSGEASKASAVEDVAVKAEKATDKKKPAVKKQPASAGSAAAIQAAGGDGKHSGSSGLLMMFVFAAAIGGGVAVFFRRSRKRSEATIAGFEAMLG